MSAVAETDVGSRMKDGWARLRMLGQAVGEYVRLVAAAQRIWLVGAALGVGAVWLNALPGVDVPWWSTVAILVATLAAVQFQAFYRVREEREGYARAQEIDAIIDAVAVLRSRETELRNRNVRAPAAYEQWKAELVALRGEIYKKLQRLSRAEAETYHTIGNLKHAAAGGINEEHDLLLAVATRDLDHLAELIHGHTRFQEP